MTKQAKKQRPMVEDQVIAEHLTSLLTPAMKSQSSFFRELGLRDRILTLTSDGSCRLDASYGEMCLELQN